MQSLGTHLSHRLSELRQVFAIRPFALFSLGNFCSLLAIWMVRVCVAWITWEQTHSKTWLGVMAFAELGPSVLISLWSGPLADKYDRMRILRFGQTIQVFFGLALAILAYTKLLDVWAMLVALLGFSVTAGITLPARLSVAPSLVPRPQVATASAIGSIALNVTRLAGPMVAAVLLAAEAETLAFLAASLLFAINAYSLSRISPGEGVIAPPRPDGPPPAYTYREVLATVLRDPVMTSVMGLQFAVSVLLRPLTDMFPAFADQVFGRGEHGFAGLTAAVGIGAIFGAGGMIGGSAGRAMLRRLVYATMALSVVTLLFSLTSNYWLALAILAVYGALLSAGGIAGTTYTQVSTPHDQLGRVMSIYGLVFRFGPALGALVIGVAADSIGVSFAAGAFAVMAACCLALLWRRLTGAAE